MLLQGSEAQNVICALLCQAVPGLWQWQLRGDGQCKAPPACTQPARGTPRCNPSHLWAWRTCVLLGCLGKTALPKLQVEYGITCDTG